MGWHRSLVDPAQSEKTQKPIYPICPQLSRCPQLHHNRVLFIGFLFSKTYVLIGFLFRKTNRNYGQVHYLIETQTSDLIPIRGSVSVRSLGQLSLGLDQVRHWQCWLLSLAFIHLTLSQLARSSVSSVNTREQNLRLAQTAICSKTFSYRKEFERRLSSCSCDNSSRYRSQ